MKIFWSWQNDYAPQRNRWFIHSALQDAVAQLADEYELQSAERPELDHDTKDEAGMVEITTAILEKIEHSVAFVADLTPIAEGPNGKPLPNPNVLIELGWALKMPGWRRMVAVMNSAEGYTPDDLPFDVRHRRALVYTLSEGADKQTRARVKKELTGSLIGALRKNLEEHLDEVAAEISPEGVDARADDRSLWASAQEEVSYLDSFGGSGKSQFGIPVGPRAYARFIPAGWRDGIPRVTEIEVIPSPNNVQPSLSGVSEGDFGACEEGYVRFWYTGPRSQKPREAGNIAMYFDQTGEFWITSSSDIYEHKDRLILGIRGIIQAWARALKTANDTFDRLGANYVRKIEFGIVGLDNVHWPERIASQSPPARKSTFLYEYIGRDWDIETQHVILTDAIDRLRDIFGLPKAPDGQTVSIAKG